jgi:hypothetical protein
MSSKVSNSNAKRPGIRLAQRILREREEISAPLSVGE